MYIYIVAHHSPWGRPEMSSERAGAFADMDGDCLPDLCIDNLLVRIHFIIVMIRWTGLAPWEFDFSFPDSLTSTFLSGPRCRRSAQGPLPTWTATASQTSSSPTRTTSSRSGSRPERRW